MTPTNDGAPGDEMGFLTSFAPSPTADSYEPSARDARRWVDPLLIRVDPVLNTIDLDWEETMGEVTYQIALGDLRRLHEERLYNHELIPPCDLREPTAALDLPPGDVYYLVIGVDKAGVASSYGRDSTNTERPVSPVPCE